MQKSIKIKIDLYADEFPTIWEQGGKGQHSASAVIVSNQKGEKLEHVYICKCNVLNGRHASYKVEEGYLIGIGFNENSKTNDNAQIGVYKITKINLKNLFADCELVEEANFKQLKPRNKKKFKYWSLLCVTARKLNFTQCNEPIYCLN